MGRRRPGMPDAMTAGRPMLMLTADDYAMTSGVSRAIRELADLGALSATSVMTTGAHWPAHAAQIAARRDRLAVGLHFNLTLGAPLGTMPDLAPGGRLPTLGDLVARALKGAIETSEIAAELGRQLDAFEAAIGHPPDHVDGHQHVHALPGIGPAVAEMLAFRYRERPPLVRNPADRVGRILARRTALAKALGVAWLGRRFAATLAAAGLPSNDSFAGITDFAVQRTRADLDRALLARGHLHLVMCHPGYPDEELARIDPVTGRRLAELELLRRPEGPRGEVWRPERAVDGPPIDWRQLVQRRP